MLHGQTPPFIHNASDRTQNKDNKKSKSDFWFICFSSHKLVQTQTRGKKSFSKCFLFFSSCFRKIIHHLTTQNIFPTRIDAQARRKWNRKKSLKIVWISVTFFLSTSSMTLRQLLTAAFFSLDFIALTSSKIRIRFTKVFLILLLASFGAQLLLFLKLQVLNGKHMKEKYCEKESLKSLLRFFTFTLR